MERLRRRQILQAFLEDLVHNFVQKKDKTSHVYYNPPTGFKLEYPCIVYNDADPGVWYADNLKYLSHTHWRVTVMSRDPESGDIASLVEELPYASYENSFISDNIAHRVYDLYF